MRQEITTLPGIKNVERESTQNVYYTKIADRGRKLDEALRETQIGRTIIDESSFVTSFLVSKEENPKGRFVEVLFLGFSAGHVAKVIFADEQWEQLISAELLEEKVTQGWELEVTALSYDPLAKRLVIGYGDKLVRDWTVGLSLGEKMELKKPGTWFVLDFENLYSETHVTCGGGIRIFSFHDENRDGTHDGFLDLSANADLQNQNNKTAVQGLYPFTSSNGQNFLFAIWGPNRVPQTYTFGVNVVPVPKPIPIPLISGGDNPNPTNYTIKLFDVRLSYNEPQNKFENITYMASLSIQNGHKKENPTVALIGKHMYNALIYGYADGSIWAYNIIGGDAGNGAFACVKEAGGAPIINLLYSVIGEEEYILIAKEDLTLEVVQYNGAKQSREGISFNYHRIDPPYQVMNNGWGSKVYKMQASVDGKYAVVALENRSVQWYSFEKKRFTGELFGPDGGLLPVAAITAPVETKTQGIYQFYISYQNGRVRQCFYNGSKGVKTYYNDISLRDNIPLDVHFGRGHHPNQILRENITVSPAIIPALDIFGIYEGIGDVTGIGWVEFGNMKYYHYDKLDFDPSTGILYAYTLAITGRIVNPSWSGTNDRLTNARIGMGIDTYNTKTGKWKTMQRPKFNFMDPSQVNAGDYRGLSLPYPMEVLAQKG